MGLPSTSHSNYEGKNIGGRRYANNNRRRNSPVQRDRSSKYRHAPTRAQEYNECHEYSQYQDYSHCHSNVQYYEQHEYGQNYEYDQQYNQQYNEQYNEYCNAPMYGEYFPHDEQSCCQECLNIQADRAEDGYRKGKHAPSRRENNIRERLPGQALPGRLVTPQRFTHNPYTLDSNVTDAFVPDYHAHEDTAQEIPKNVVLCLRWVNGTCGEKKKSASFEDRNTPVECPYAHPDLSEVPPGVCATYWFTGFCRFDRRDATLLELEDESFGLHGWSHYRRLEPNYSQTVSDDSSNDDGSKKTRRRPASICYACHHAQPVGGFPLLPGISCKTTVLEREAALAMYPKWY